MRLCVDLKILPIKKQAELAALMDGIGRQITGWRNAGRYLTRTAQPASGLAYIA